MHPPMNLATLISKGTRNFKVASATSRADQRVSRAEAIRAQRLVPWRTVLSS